MMRLFLDVLYVYDMDTVLSVLSIDVLDYTMTLEAPDWWCSEAEKQEAAYRLTELETMVIALQYDFGEDDDTRAY